MAISAAGSLSFLLPRDRNLDPTPPTFRETYERALNSRGDRGVLMKKFQNVIQDQIVGPLFEKAEANPDPSGKARDAAVALAMSHHLNFLPRGVLSEVSENSADLSGVRSGDLDHNKAMQASLAEFLKSLEHLQKSK